MVYFVEYFIFKGIWKWKVWYILNCMENVGGDLNVYINKEEIVIYLVFLIEYFGRVLELLVDIVFYFIFL